MAFRCARGDRSRGAVARWLGIAGLLAWAAPLRAQEAFRWEPMPALAAPVAGVGAHGDALVAVGSAAGELRAWVLPDADAREWSDAGALTAVGRVTAVFGTDAGVVVLGSPPGAERAELAVRLAWRTRERTLHVDALPPLPAESGKVLAAAGLDGDACLLTGGDAPALWRFSPAPTGAQPARGWTRVPLPKAVRAANAAGAALAEQALGDGRPGLHLFDASARSWRLEPGGTAWTPGAAPPREVVPRAAAPLGQAHVIVASADGALHAYHLITDTWVRAGTALPPVRALVPWRDGLVLLGEAELRFGTAAPRDPALGVVDGAVIVGYLLLLVGMGAWFSRRERGTDDYFLAGKRIPWWAAGLSLFATQLSAITFLSTPAVSFATDWLLLPSWFGILLFAPIAVAFYLPRYLRLDVRTAYEFLERRFHLAVRWFGCASFVVFQFARMGVVVYLPALALEFATGLPLAWCIVVMGVLATVYTVLGGMEAVVWTDVLQTLVLMGGVGATLVLVALGVGDVGAALELAAARGKTQVLQSGWSLTEAVTWSIALGGLFLQFGPYTADQAMVQRYLTTKDRRTAARGIWLNGWMSVPAGFLFMLVGTALWVFYRAHPERLQVGMSNDQIFPLFLAHELPVGLAGLVIAGLFAAAMSTLDSGMHAIATTLTHDVYRRLRRVDDRRALRVARVLTVVAGVIGTVVALVLASGDIRSLLLFFLKSLGLVSSALAGVFFLGVFTRRANAPGVLCGAGAAVALLAWLAFGTDAYLFVYPLAGIPCSVAVGYVASLLIPVAPRDDAVPD